MKNTEVRSQGSEVSHKQERCVFGRLRSISSLTLVAVLVCAALAPGLSFAFAQKPQPAPPTQPAQLDYNRLAAAALVTEFGVNGFKFRGERRHGSFIASAALFLPGASTT